MGRPFRPPPAPNHSTYSACYNMDCTHEYEESVETLCNLLAAQRIVPFPVWYACCIPGSNSGDNYMSVVKRIQISSQPLDYDGRINGSSTCEHAGKSSKISLIIKRQIPSLSRRQLYRCDEAFCNEINAYKHLVPLLEQYISGADSFFPKCHFAGIDDAGEIIVLEDLKELGYRMQNRLKGLELNYCELVMKQLAKLHAASIAAKQLNSAIFREQCKHIHEIVYCKEAEEFYRNILDTSIQESLHSLRTSNNDGSLTEPIRLIEKLQSTLFQHIQARITNAKDSLSVVCHGDLWVNNIMFRPAEPETGTPAAVKFFDLQAMRYTSPVFDILNFIYTSTKRDLRDAHTTHLLETYCTALSTHLGQHFEHAQPQLDAVRDTFSLRSITAEYYEHVLYGLAISMWILPAVTFDPNNIPNLNAISESNTSAKEIKCTQMLTPEYHSRLKDLALEFYQKGYLDSYSNAD